MVTRGSFITFCLLTLAACGGGSSGETSLNSQPAVTAPSTQTLDERVSVISPEAVSVDQSVSLLAFAADITSLQNRRWQQLSGPTISFLSSSSQVIAFDVPESGDYSFEFTAEDSNGNSTTKTVSFSANQNPSPIVASVRLDHEVVETGKVSLRADVIGSDEPFNVEWQQMQGPEIPAESLTTQGQFLFFDAPNVSKDEILEFQAQITFENGETYADNAYVLIKNALNNPDGFFPDAYGQIVFEGVFPFDQDGPYSAQLKNCIFNNQINQSCSFSSLPLIGQTTNNPTVDDVMSRVLVSHQWMGERFKRYLETSPVSEDIIRLLKAVTGVVISYDVRPSFYWAATGAIYLDPDNFWVTPEERDTLNDVPDYRSNFGQDLSFIFPWRYVKDRQDYLNGNPYPKSERQNRTIEDVQADITWLLFHELAHANDFFPPNAHSSIAMNTSPLSYANNNPATSSGFSQIYPLNSTQLKSLAQVSFRGETPNQTQRDYDASDIENFFSNDDAVMYYSYSTEREDFATLFEHFMMAYRLDVHSDVAVISVDSNPDSQVHWGQRGRITHPNLAARTEFVVNSIYPELLVPSILSTLDEPESLLPGVSWFDNLIDEPDESPTSEADRKKLAERKIRHMKLPKMQ